MIKGARVAREIGPSERLAGWGAEELMPGKHVQSDATM
jgi:hypothetical protein